MPADELFHIVLLPHEDYWEWVGAVRDYVVHFGTPVTPFPENAVKYHRPEQTVSIVSAPDTYATYGDIRQWFRENAPEVRIEILKVRSSDELRQMLSRRVAADMRFGASLSEREPEEDATVATTEPTVASVPEPSPRTGGVGPGIALWWPTDHAYITQRFGSNPDYYGRFNLPGHEGVDIRAPANANIYACADGTVFRVEHDPNEHAYGKHVRIRHAGNYKTVYAHLNEVLVDVGDEIKAGQIVGLADNTGNSFGDHLHLTLKLEGATAAGLTNYPYDIIDPTPFLVPLDQIPREVSPPKPTWAFDKCLVGLHGRADGRMEEADWPAVRTANVEALKLLSWARGEDVDRAREINSNMFIIVRAMLGFEGNKISAQYFADEVARDLERHYGRGIRYFEVHNEPNLTIEGWGTSWRDGSEFASWFLRVIEILDQDFPEAKWGWPGLSPGPGIDGQRFYMWDFIRGARDAIKAADWLGVHCYWQGANDSAIFKPDTGLEYQAFRDQWPDKTVFITEFSNSSRDVDKATKARQYVKYYQHLRDEDGVGGAFSFVLSASRHFGHEAWRREDGSLTAIPAAVGARPDF